MGAGFEMLLSGTPLGVLLGWDSSPRLVSSFTGAVRR